MGDVVDLALAVARAFERCGIAYFLGGSLASSFQGEPRATNDIDFVVDMTEAQARQLAAVLGPDFEVDEPALERAVRERSSWNIIHLPTVTKVDLFVLRRHPFDASEFSRRELVEVRPGQPLYMKRAEDTVLRKLLWYRAGGGVSDRQWRDVVAVLRLSRGLDRAYLEEWAARLAVDDLLTRAIAESTSERA